jgi:predicted transcriptional regulator
MLRKEEQHHSRIDFFVEKSEEDNSSVKEMLVSAVCKLVKEDQFEKAILMFELLQNFKEGK